MTSLRNRVAALTMAAGFSVAGMVSASPAQAAPAPSTPTTVVTTEQVPDDAQQVRRSTRAKTSPYARKSVASYCAITKSQVSGGINFSKLRVARVCNVDRNTGTVYGAARLSKNQMVVWFRPGINPIYVKKATTHELAHFAEWRTTPAMRAKLYSYLGVKMDGNYFAIPTASGKNLPAWKANARERLAESAVKCAYGSNSFSGMKLVPQSKCKAFMRDLQTAVNVAR